jgi:hypothetical protein
LKKREAEAGVVKAQALFFEKEVLRLVMGHLTGKSVVKRWAELLVLEMMRVLGAQWMQIIRRLGAFRIWPVRLEGVNSSKVQEFLVAWRHLVAWLRASMELVQWVAALQLQQVALVGLLRQQLVLVAAVQPPIMVALQLWVMKAQR